MDGEGKLRGSTLGSGSGWLGDEDGGEGHFYGRLLR